jgi:predicted metalloendopeptidase
MNRPTLFAALTALALSAPAAAATLPPPSPSRAYMDTTCAPCKDFFQFANGAWYATAEIPPSYIGVGAGREMADRNQAALHEVLDRVSASTAGTKDPALRKVGDLYRVLMDSTRADREGAAPLAGDLARIAALKTPADLPAEFARAALNGIGGGMWGGGGLPFRLGSEPDPKHSKDVIAQLTQGGLGLPERDYYFRDDERSKQLRADYVAYMGTMFKLLGDSPEAASRKADAVMALETALAESSLSAVQMRDPKALYHKMTLRELGLLTPGLDWPGYFRATGLPKLADPAAALDVSMPAFMRRVGSLLADTPMETWRAYLQWNTARARAGWLGQAFFDASFAFQSKLTGSRTPEPRWKRAAGLCDRLMGEALGKAYVEEYFPPSSKARMVELVNNLQAALGDRIASRPWMSAATKAQAQKKLSAILKKIGYPDKWRDYSGLGIDPSQPAAVNIARAAEFNRRYELSFIGKPVDRSLWGMTPPTVNAYYNPTFNEIVFPAGILSPPQFDPRVDDAVNYGAIGMVIGHELTHGFDDEGRQYDADGNLKDWWASEDSRKFDALAEKVVKQYDAYVAVDSLHLNGKLTLGENIADLGGLTIAYRAWELSLKGKPAPVIDGWTGPQRFFLGYAQAWRRKNRPESMRTAALTDPHSSAYWRVNGPLSNLRQFREAFGCRAGDAMVREDTFEIW